MLAELQELNQNIEHIKKIVAMQQTYAKVSGSSETVDPSELMEDAVRINIDSFSRHGILILRKYAPALPTLNLERHKALQILVNLLRNAKQALTSSPNSPRQIVLSLHTQVSNHLAFVIRGNGVGIAHENLTSIFRHGFTTKKKGHGFGLHSSANAAREMYGRLSAHSNGPGTGAEFTLELPIPSPSLSSSSP
jgi:C4-dicarboxylate-specific signal transduction histidine kinase